MRPRRSNGEFTPPLVRLSFGTEGLIDLAEFGHPAPLEAIPTRLSALPSAQAAAHPATAGAAEARPRPMDEIWRELDSLIGLTSVKALVREISAYVDIQRRRAREQLAADPLVLHMFFKGNPGTGKTTVARLLGRLFREMSVLQKGHLVETERADLVGEYIGHTAQKTRDQLKKAMGGILFVDEAHALARGGEKDFGKEAIDTMVKAMEDHKDNLVVILAGYRREMEYFVRQNPGLKSRFPIRIDFPDFTLDELTAISRLMLQRRQYRLSAEGEAKLSELLASRASREENSGNARLVRNILERAIRRHATRLVNHPDASRDELMLLLPEDIEETTE